MKDIYYSKCIDQLGRIVIPKKIREKLNIGSGENLDIYLENDNILIKKCSESCIFCKSSKDIINYKGKNICKKCLKEINNKLEN